MPNNMPQPMERGQNRYYDISYGLASAAVTTGVTIITTTGGNYHGASIIAGATAQAVVKIYDNASTTSGNLMDVFTVTQGQNAWIDRYIPVVAKNGMTISLTGTGSEGAIFYGPKG